MKKNTQKRVLIAVPKQDTLGGVYNFYENLKDLLDEKISYYYVGAPRENVKNKILLFFIYLWGFFKRIKNSEEEVVILNTSLNLNAVVRDSLYLIIGKLYKKEVILFWRGWNFDNVKYLKFPYSLITKSLLRPEKTIVLYSEIGNTLRGLGYKRSIYQLTTMVNESAFEYQVKERSDDQLNLVFLSRVEVYKGVNELLDAYQILKIKYPSIQLNIAGNGSELESLKEKVKNSNIQDVVFEGYVTGDKKYDLLASGDLFIFPSYSEGMPNAVLEAMAVGLPLVTTRVGGLNDFFKDEVMGHFVEMKNAEDLVDKIERLYLDTEKRMEISAGNRNYAANHFKRTIVYDKLKKIISEEV